jgi:hypothetical protein
MDENAVAGTFFESQLARGLEERLALDVACRPADFLMMTSGISVSPISRSAP